jgi:hypothetical protein
VRDPPTLIQPMNLSALSWQSKSRSISGLRKIRRSISRIAHQMLQGLDEDGITPGVRMEFPPDFNLSAIQFLLQPEMALTLVDQLQKLEGELGWKRATPFLKN